MALLKVFKFVLFLTLLLIFNNCAKTDPITGERVIIDPNLDKRASEYRDKGGGLFGNTGKKDQANNFEFASSNIIWRATLKSLDFLPLINADYSGGVIIYDWYSDKINSSEQIKITIRFLGSDIKSESIKIISHKKICNVNEKCSIIILDESFSNQIKDKIINEARLIKIEEAKKNTK